MSLTVHELEMYINSGTPSQIAYSKAILPLRRRGNLLLCTILIGCTLANSVATTLLNTIADGTIAVVVSTAGIVIFGEIVPQSICSRHGQCAEIKDAPFLPRICSKTLMGCFVPPLDT